MAGHSHWAGIKHKKGRADKIRSKIFSKLSREITVAAKLGDKDPDMNHRLRSAIQAARSANMPKDNIDRAIDKSKFNDPRWFWLLLSKPSKSLIDVAFTFGSWYSFFPISSNALGSSVPAEKIPLGL